MELKIDKNLKELIDSFCPVKLIYNDEVIWDDYLSDNFLSDVELYEDFFKYTDAVVKSINFEVVMFHHTIVRIYS